MTVPGETAGDEPAGILKLPLAASLVALVGLVDAAYLTIKHLIAEPVPCSLIEGCEQVLTSSYAEIAGIPVAAFGAVAYFAAFSLAILAAYGNRQAWPLFGLLSLTMAAASVWFIYLQAFVIEAYCQFCLLSAATSFTLFALFAVSLLRGRGFHAE